jgi:hypothetical protein
VALLTTPTGMLMPYQTMLPSTACSFSLLQEVKDSGSPSCAGMTTSTLSLSASFLTKNMNLFEFLKKTSTLVDENKGII